MVSRWATPRRHSFDVQAVHLIGPLSRGTTEAKATLMEAACLHGLLACRRRRRKVLLRLTLCATATVAGGAAEPGGGHGAGAAAGLPARPRVPAERLEGTSSLSVLLKPLVSVALGIRTHSCRSSTREHAWQMVPAVFLCVLLGVSLSVTVTRTAQILDAHKTYDPATVHRMAFADASSRAKKHMDGAAALKQVRSGHG